MTIDQAPDIYEKFLSLFNATPEEFGQAAIKAVRTTEGATQTDLEGEQLNDGRVSGQQTNVDIEQNPGYGNYKMKPKISN